MNPQDRKKLLVVDVAALSEPFDWDNLTFHAADSVLPAVTCTVQASFRTASWPAEHGMVANGLFFRDLRRVMFWEQSAKLVTGERIWSPLRRRGGTVAMLFWQQSLGEDVDVVLSPAPIHKHHGGMIQDCYSRPDGLYRRLCSKIGRRFKLRQYWGPMATPKVGDWITQATTAVIADELAPDLCLTYLPTLDYDLQRHEADSEKARIARSALENQLRELLTAARREGYETVLFGDYRIGPVERAVFPNRALAQAGLLKTRPVKDMLYPDFWASRAFAVADHQVAHVYVTDPADVDAAREVLSQVPGVDVVMDADAQRAARVAHPNGGELLLLAEPGTWFAYPWWVEPRQQPDYAGHVDIHGKCGYDPCELFWGWPPGRIGQDPGKVRGSHGLAGPGNRVVWGATMDLPGPIASLVDLATAVRNWMNK